jgi:hypothetical protein
VVVVASTVVPYSESGVASHILKAGEIQTLPFLVVSEGSVKLDDIAVVVSRVVQVDSLGVHMGLQSLVAVRERDEYV